MPQIDLVLSLSFSMQSSPGVYALLLGSGVSRASQIPTGWEIVLDLIRKLARMQGDNAAPDPAAWYSAKFGKEPDYSDLLDGICKTSAERQQLLRSYFEPTETEREEGAKRPTAAHRAIAKLVAGGYCRIILTTNFDRLIEQALADEGITPTVLSTPDAIDGAMPLAHQRCCVIKLHGDFTDIRIKNTPSELDCYDARSDELLDQVFDQYGLVVCGWSAEWDTALRRAIERSKNRRFTTYWASRGTPGNAAQGLINHRMAQLVTIADADSFFSQLLEKIQALAGMDVAHPLSAKVAVAQTKKYLDEPRHRIALHDLLMEEVERVVKATGPERYPISGTFQAEDVARRIGDFERLSEIAISIVAVGCYWGSGPQSKLWAEAITRLGNPPGPLGGDTCMLGLRSYPALLMICAGGIAAVAGGHEETWLAILSLPKVADERRGQNLLEAVANDVEDQWFKSIPGLKDKAAPRSLRLKAVLREPLRHLIPDDGVYDRCFETYETIQTLWMADTAKWAMPGLFMWYLRREPWRVSTIFHQWNEEVKSQGKGWWGFKIGLCRGDPDRWAKATLLIEQMANSLH